jgi:copper(I)-binding protein
MLALVLSACGAPAAQSSRIEVADPWVRAVSGMQSMDTPAAMFMIIKNSGSTADKLIKVQTDVARMSQIHLSEMDANGVASMHEVDGVEIPAGGSVAFKSGSYHIMLMGLQSELKPGDTVRLTLTFEQAGDIIVDAPVKAP